jgi:hypothetical protein
MLLAQSALIPPVVLLTCDALAGGVCVAGGGVTVVVGGGVCVAGGGVTVVAGGGVCVVAGGGGGVTVVAGGGVCVVSPSPAGGGVCVVSSSSAGGVDNVGQLPLASGVEPSGHDCAYEDCSIEDDDDCTVRIAAVTRITLIIIDNLLYIICSSCL